MQINCRQKQLKERSEYIASLFIKLIEVSKQTTHNATDDIYQKQQKTFTVRQSIRWSIHVVELHTQATFQLTVYVFQMPELPTKILFHTQSSNAIKC